MYQLHLLFLMKFNFSRTFIYNFRSGLRLGPAYPAGFETGRRAFGAPVAVARLVTKHGCVKRHELRVSSIVTSFVSEHRNQPRVRTTLRALSPFIVTCLPSALRVVCIIYTTNRNKVIRIPLGSGTQFLHH
jgi:hypothetical protein